MVFGWGKKKAPPQEEVSVRIRLDEAPGIADEVMAKRTRNMVTEAANKLHSTNKLIRELAKMRKDLERDDLNLDAVDKRVRPLAVRGKKMLVNALKSNAVEIKPIRVPQDMSGSAGELEHRLKRLGNILGKQSRVIHLFAEKYATRLKQILEEVDGNRHSIMGIFYRHQNYENLANAVTNGIENVRGLEAAVRDNAEKRSEAEAEIQRLEVRAARLESDIADYRASAEHARLLGLRRRLQEAEDAKARLSSEIALQFTSISRPLGRYEWVSSDKEQTALLRRAQKSPYEVMNRGEEESVAALLQNILKAVKSGSISVKDVGKAAEAMERAIGAVGGYVERVEGTEAELAKTRQMIRDAEPVRLREMEKELEEVRESKEMAVRKASQTAAAMTLSIQSIPVEIADVREALLQITGTKYEIAYRGPGPE